MDFVASMFQSDRSLTTDEFQFFPIPCQHKIQQEDELILIPNSEDANVLFHRSDHSHRRRKAATAFGVYDGKPNDNNKKKKIIHRENERQRRQEMTTLYATLRSLLPFEYLKGKRSIPDHMNEAVNYIKRLQKKIMKLSDKRDELKKSSNSIINASTFVPETLSQESSEDNIMVRPCLAGMEAVISTCPRQGLQLSSVLEVIVAEGLIVVSCISTKVNKRLIMHTIVSEVKENGRSIEPSDLQHKLTMLTIPSSELNLAVLTK
ncbi:hypothetical protein REPUB_Repub08aG0191700 [Reevesia pubescens]